MNRLSRRGIRSGANRGGVGSPGSRAVPGVLAAVVAACALALWSPAAAAAQPGPQDFIRPARLDPAWTVADGIACAGPLRGAVTGRVSRPWGPPPFSPDPVGREMNGALHTGTGPVEFTLSSDRPHLDATTLVQVG